MVSPNRCATRKAARRFLQKAQELTTDEILPE
jgi:hypothetical protein